MVCDMSRMGRMAGLLVLLSGLAAGPAGAAHPPAAEMLPENTVAMLVSPNVPELKDRFAQTAWGRMFHDPQVQPLTDRFMSALGTAMAGGLQAGLDLTLPELLDLPRGELAWAVVPLDAAPPAMVIILDAGDPAPQLDRALLRATDAMQRGGAHGTDEDVAGTKLSTFSSIGPQGRQVAFCVKEGTLIAGTDPAVVKQVLGLWQGRQPNGQPPSLADTEHYRLAMQACNAAGQSAQLSAFVDPLGVLRAMANGNPGMQIGLALLPVLGLNGVDGAAATLALDTSQLDYLLQAHLLMSPQRGGVLDVVALGEVEPVPEKWVPAEADGYTTANWRFDPSFQAFVKVYDSFRSDGATAALLRDRVQAPTGLDLENEALPSLEGRVSMASWPQPNASPPQSLVVVGLKLRDVSRMQRALDKVSDQQKANLSPQSYLGHAYWEVNTPAPPPPRPGAGGAGGSPAPPRPRFCFGIVDEYVLVANQPAAYQKALSTAGDSQAGLAEALEYKVVLGKAARLANPRPGLFNFSRPEEGWRQWHTQLGDPAVRRLIHDRAAHGLFFQALDTAVSSAALPPFNAIEQYFAPSGAVLTDEPSGLHYVGFGLHRSSP